MVTVHCLATAVRGKDKNYLLLGLFFVGALINSTGNIYIRFFVTTIEPYIGSWIMMGSFVLFIESYLALPENRTRLVVGKGILALSGMLLFVSIGHNLIVGRRDTWVIFSMDLVTAVLLLGLMAFLLVHAVRGNRKGFYLFLLELTIVIGGIAALGVTKALVVDSGLFPIEFFQSNMVFIVGMTVNGILFSNLLGFDLMDLKVKTAVVQERNRELKELDKAKNDLMMNISHEFRTPITIIGGVTKQLKHGKWGDSISANRKNLEVIERNSLRLHKQVEGLLQLATMEQQTQTIRPVPIDLSSVLPALVGEFSSVADMKGISISVSVSEEVRIVADAGLFRTALVNLVGNGLKFTPPGGTVSVEASKVSGEVQIAVHDTGCGIPEDEHQRVFRRFHQVHVPGGTRKGGAGIGLSLVKLVMDHHNGRVELESAPGNGSTFTLVFPVPENVPTPVDGDARVAGDAGTAIVAVSDGSIWADANQWAGGPGSARENRAAGDMAPQNSRTRPVVLLAEDDPELRRFLRTELASQFSLLTARNGSEALQLMRQHIPDLVISDVMMPEMDGYQLLEAMQKDEHLRHVPLLLLTARDSEEERTTAYARGVVDYIAKPFSMQMLVARARNIIETNSTFKERYQQYVKQSVISFLEGLPSDQESARDQEPDGGFSDHCRLSHLTEREMEVALLVRKGLSDKQVASDLGLSAKTVGNYNSSIFRKCGFAGRLDLVTWGRRPKSGSEAGTGAG